MREQQDSLKPFVSLIVSTKISKLALTIGLIGSVITTLVGLTIPLFAKEIVDGSVLGAISTTIIIAIGIAFILQAIINGFSMYLLAAIGQRIVAKRREFMWLKLIRLPVSYFDKTASGESVSRVVNDTGIVKDLISQHFPRFIIGIISIIGAVTILLIMDWKMTLIMMISVPLTLALMIPLGRKMRKISRGLQRSIFSSVVFKFFKRLYFAMGILRLFTFSKLSIFLRF